MKWLFVVLLALQAHFAVSCLVPLDAEAQRTFGGRLRWAWQWSVGTAGRWAGRGPTVFPLASRDEVISAILVGLPAAGNAVPQVLPAALRAYDEG